MKDIFSKINLRILNISAWIVVVLAYILPLSSDSPAKRAGLPFPFLTVYENISGKSLFSSFHINAVVLLADIAAVYLVLVCATKIFRLIKGKDKR